MPSPDQPDQPSAEVSPVDTGLRERIGTAIHNALCSQCEDVGTGLVIRTADMNKAADAVLPVFEQAHGDLVARNAVLRSERDALAREVERLTAEVERLAGMRAIYRRNWMAAGRLFDERWDEIQRLQRQLARSTPALPDGAEEQIAQCLADYWIDLRGGRVPFEETDAGQAREVVALVRSWLSSPATDPEPATEQTNPAQGELSGTVPQRFQHASEQTNADPEPATPDGPTAEWRAGWAAACRALDRFAAERMDAADDLDDMPVADAYGAVTVRAQHWMYNPERAPVAPQAPAEPTGIDFFRPSSRWPVVHQPIPDAACPACRTGRDHTIGDVHDHHSDRQAELHAAVKAAKPGEFVSCEPILRAGPAVPEDTGTCPECHCAAPIHKTWCKTGDHGDDLNARFLKPDSHRADTTRPAGEES